MEVGRRKKSKKWNKDKTLNMAFRLVSSGGAVVDPTMLNLAASGVITPNAPVDLVRSGTGGAVVAPSTNSSTTTMVIGVGLDYVQGASDTSTRVILCNDSQLWEVDCANSATTAQVGLRHALSVSRGFVHNTATDVTGQTGVFLALAMTGLTTGSGKLLGRIQSYDGKLIPVTDTTFLQ